jgi:hypothetical protein
LSNAEQANKHLSKIKHQKSIMSTTCTFTYRAALYLNNTALSLMKQACYGQAFDTLNNAVQLIQMEREDALLVHHMLLKSMDCISNPIVSTGPMHTLVFVSHTEPLALDDASISDYQFLIHFDLCDDELLQGEQEVEPMLSLTNAILIYNLACCSMCIPEQKDNGLSYLGFALFMLKKLFQASQQDAFFISQKDTAFSLRVVLVSTLALNTLITSQLDRGQMVQAQESLVQLKLLSGVATALQATAGWDLCAAAA